MPELLNGDEELCGAAFAAGRDSMRRLSARACIATSHEPTAGQISSFYLGMATMLAELLAADLDAPQVDALLTIGLHLEALAEVYERHGVGT